jgi:anti-anti-sigma regulatory factor
MKGTSIELKAQPSSRQSRLILGGEITEDTDLQPVVTKLAPEVVVDLERITRINSVGLREWLSFVRAVEAEGKRLILERCAPPVVAQINMIANFTGANGSVRSVLAPYHCTSCGADQLQLIDLNAPNPEAKLEESMKCPSCGDEMVFDDLPQSYLMFHTLDGGSN